MQRLREGGHCEDEIRRWEMVVAFVNISLYEELESRYVKSGIVVLTREKGLI